VRRFIIRVVMTAMVLIGGTVATPGVAGAHTDAEAVPADAGRSRISLTPEQECGDGSLATSGLRVQIPDGASDARPVTGPGWTVEVTATEVRWSSQNPETGLPTFVVEMVLAQPAGSTLYLPAIQLCPGGDEIPWIQIPASPAEAVESPAPAITVPINATRPTAAPPTTTAASTPRTEEGATTTFAMDEADSTEERGPFIWVALAAGAVVIASAAVIYVRRRSRT
jgi:uncharacterized protein YcnI